MAIRPDIGAVEVDVDRDVADELHATRVRVTAQLLPALFEEELLGHDEIDARAELVGDGGERGRLAVAERLLPLPPAAATVLLFERHEQRVVDHPRLGRFERAHPRMERVRLVLDEGARRALEEGALPREHALELDLVDVERRHARQIAGGQQPVGDELLEVDEPRVAGERRRARVGRRAGARRNERQHLPPGQPGRRQPIDEGASPRSDVTDAKSARQRRWMEQNTADARKDVLMGHRGANPARKDRENASPAALHDAHRVTIQAHGEREPGSSGPTTNRECARVLSSRPARKGCMRAR